MLATLDPAELALASPRTILSELRSALLLVDCQNRFACERGPDGSFVPLPVVAEIEKLLALARRLDIPRFHVTVASHVNGAYNGANDTGPWLRRIVDITGITDPRLLTVGQTAEDQAIVASLAPEPGEVWLHKQRFSAFYETGLEIALRSAGVEALVVCGVASYGCIYTTCLDANFRGFFSFVPAEATAGELPALHDAAMTMIGAQNIIDIPTVADAWDGSSVPVEVGP
jgi:nicotinamidase-related amidase